MNNLTLGAKPRGRPKLDPSVRLKKTLQTNNALRKRLKRLQLKVSVQNKTIKMMQSKRALESTQLDMIDGALMELVANEAKNKDKKTESRYSKKIRCFAFTVHYYSPKTYRYLRSIFSLPHPNTIRSWMQSVNCEPGFLLDVIKTVPAQSNSNICLYSLVIDSMSIRQRLIKDQSSDLIRGFVDFGNGLADSEKKMAKEALVFLLVPLTSRTRYPIGYFLVDKVSATTQVELIHQCLQLTSQHGISVVNITLDGCAANISTLQKLGANLPNQPHFHHPSSGEKVCNRYSVNVKLKFQFQSCYPLYCFRLM